MSVGEYGCVWEGLEGEGRGGYFRGLVVLERVESFVAARND